MEQAAQALYDAVAARLAPYVTTCVTQRYEEAFGVLAPEVMERATVAGQAASAEVLPELASLLNADIDEQRSTPLSLLRRAVAHADVALGELGVPAIPADRFHAERFPGDHYLLTPASLAVLGEDVGDLAITWGAAKAMAHRRRHLGPSRERR